MEEITFVDPPNRPMDTNFQPSQGAVLHKDLIFIDVDENGRILVGSTNVTASFWEGSLQVFKDFKSYEDKSWQSFYNSSLIYDGKLLSKTNSILISEGISYLKLFNIPDETSNSNAPWQDCVEHVAKIREISVNEEQTKALTVSDKFLSLWDLQESGGIKNVIDYTDYHTDDVKGAAMMKGNNNVFASVGLDRRLCLWDIRMDIPASEVYVHGFCGLTAVSWNPINPNIICVGDEGGSVHMFDITQPKEIVDYAHCYRAPVYKIKFNNSGYLAVCGNSPEVAVFTVSKTRFELVYKTEPFVNFIRGLAWCNNSLYMSGLSNCLNKHSF